MGNEIHLDFNMCLSMFLIRVFFWWGKRKYPRKNKQEKKQNNNSTLFLLVFWDWKNIFSLYICQLGKHFNDIMTIYYMERIQNWVWTLFGLGYCSGIKRNAYKRNKYKTNLKTLYWKYWKKYHGQKNQSKKIRRKFKIMQWEKMMGLYVYSVLRDWTLFYL